MDINVHRFKDTGNCCNPICSGIHANRKRVTSKERKKMQVRAAGLINMRIRRGKLTRPDTCSICKEKKKVDAHHDDYNKPEEVRWMCRSCHVKHHVKIDWI